MKIKTALVEDNSLLARSIKESVLLFDDVEVVFVACNGQDAIQKMSAVIPDVVLMDINMPVMDGIEATRRIHHLFPGVKIVMLTVFDEADKIFEAILAGATGYLLKDEKPQNIHAALVEAMEGGAPMSPVIAMKALHLIRGKKTAPTAAANTFDLSAREIEVLELIAAGDTYQQIAVKLFVSPRTVRKHIENIYRKMQVHNKTDALRLAFENKLV